MPPRHSPSKRQAAVFQSPRKPEMERKRRQRINECLFQIKQLIPEAKELEMKKGCRLEKAEILEIAVHFIQTAVDKQREIQEMKKTGVSSCLLGAEQCTNPNIPLMRPWGGHFNAAQVQEFSACYGGYESRREMPPKRLYPPLLRPTPRVFTPLFVSSNAVFPSGASGQSSQSADLVIPKLETTGLD